MSIMGYMSLGSSSWRSCTGQHTGLHWGDIRKTNTCIEFTCLSAFDIFSRALHAQGTPLYSRPLSSPLSDLAFPSSSLCVWLYGAITGVSRG